MNAAEDRNSEKALVLRCIAAPAANPDRSGRASRRIGILRLAFLALIASHTGVVAALVTPEPPKDAERAAALADRRDCLRCHAMTTLAYRSPETGAIVDLSIDPAALGHSVHGDLACVDCHRRSYRRYPHPDRPPPNDLDCIGCHRDDERDLGRDWLDIDAEFRRSVHALSDAPDAADFSCHSCHDPHRIRPAVIGEPIVEIIGRHNRVCLSCHEEVMTPPSTSHDWLPNRDAHWTSVRCVDCHTPAGPHANHEILAATDSARDCVGCHSGNPTLLARLYHFRSDEEIARSGLLAKALLNESYVVGMSKSPALDALSLIIMGFMALLLAAHGVGRYLAHRAQRRHP